MNVIVKDGKTTNLKRNFPAINGDLEVLGSAPKSTPVLEDGEYDPFKFEYVLQMDDNGHGKWIDCYNSEEAINRGWKTRATLYFYKDNELERLSPSIHFLPTKEKTYSEQELYSIAINFAFQCIAVEGQEPRDFPYWLKERYEKGTYIDGPNYLKWVEEKNKLK